MLAKNPFRGVQPGDGLGFPAQFYNALLESLKQQLSGTLRRSRESSTEILVKNTSATPITQQFGILGLENPFATQAQNAAEFADRRAMKGIAPAAGEPFVVAKEPLSMDAIGEATLLGLTPCQVNLTDTAHRYAGPSVSTTTLTSASTGPARILWTASGFATTGVQWALVNLLGDEPPDDETAFVRVTSLSPVGTPGGSVYPAVRLRNEGRPASSWPIAAECWYYNVRGETPELGVPYLSRRNAETHLDLEQWDSDNCCAGGGEDPPDPGVSACCPDESPLPDSMAAIAYVVDWNGGDTSLWSSFDVIDSFGFTLFTGDGGARYHGQVAIEGTMENQTLDVTLRCNSSVGGTISWYGRACDPEFTNNTNNWILLTGPVAVDMVTTGNRTTCDPLCFQFFTNLAYTSTSNPFTAYASLDYTVIIVAGADCASGGGGGGGGGCFGHGLDAETGDVLQVPEVFSGVFGTVSGTNTSDGQEVDVPFHHIAGSTLWYVSSTFSLNGHDAQIVIGFGFGPVERQLYVTWEVTPGGEWTSAPGSLSYTGGVYTISIEGIDTGDGGVLDFNSTFDTADCE